MIECSQKGTYLALKFKNIHTFLMYRFVIKNNTLALKVVPSLKPTYIEKTVNSI